MGLIAFINDVIRTSRRGANVTDIQSNPGGNNNRTAEHFAPSGDDSPPLPGDYAYYGDTLRTGVFASLGCVDPKNEQLAANGEKRLYGRNPSGEVVCTHWLKGDGTITSYNEKSTVTQEPDGTIETKNDNATQTIDSDGTVTTETGDITTTQSVDGSFFAENTLGVFSLTSDGIFSANGVQILPNGTIVTPTGIIAPSVIAGGKELVEHDHDENDNAPNPTGTNN